MRDQKTLDQLWDIISTNDTQGDQDCQEVKQEEKVEESGGTERGMETSGGEVKMGEKHEEIANDGRTANSEANDALKKKTKKKKKPKGHCPVAEEMEAEESEEKEERKRKKKVKKQEIEEAPSSSNGIDACAVEETSEEPKKKKRKAKQAEEEPLTINGAIEEEASTKDVKKKKAKKHKVELGEGEPPPGSEEAGEAIVKKAKRKRKQKNAMELECNGHAEENGLALMECELSGDMEGKSTMKNKCGTNGHTLSACDSPDTALNEDNDPPSKLRKSKKKKRCDLEEEKNDAARSAKKLKLASDKTVHKKTKMKKSV